ncbi:NUDIX domain-containing protein [Geomonas sp.]|uniref:NUDIX domain-containing protein n=1 Tax=Geomonas sp. TaxID=2651584 RepID=UPI002B4A6153|nr:NUDIX domain-containing protein [Geomonas sp.]HJV34840.1 NUDIX domain-containing protein [Geomonas sp.]
MAVGASLLIINRDREILLLLRDDKPQIKYPGMWDIPGGNLEGDETPAECIRREIEEELGLAISNYELFQVKRFPDRLEYTFWMEADLDIAGITLTEGQKLAWFSEEQAASTELAFGFNATISAFFEKAPFLSRRK